MLYVIVYCLWCTLPIFPSSSTFFVLDIQHRCLHSEKSLFLACNGECAWTHVSQRFIIKDTVAGTLQQQQWHYCSTACTQCGYPCMMGKQHVYCYFLLHVFTAWTDCTVWYVTYCRHCHVHMNMPTSAHNPCT